MKTLCIIPARKGSKAIKDKNIKILNGEELFLHSLKFAKKLKFVNQIVFSSDSKKYLKIASKIKNILLSKRPSNLSNDSALMIDVIKYEINKLKKKRKTFRFCIDFATDLSF